jgi:hypothetical protein
LQKLTVIAVAGDPAPGPAQTELEHELLQLSTSR